MHQLKPIPDTAVPAAIEKALRYRLLNDPLEAESICLDVLLVDPNNQQALVTMLLALTDLFDAEYAAALKRAQAVLPRLTGEYDLLYFEGVIHERWAKAEAARGVPFHVVRGWLLAAMHCYERAEELAKDDNPDAALRYNTCVRLLDRGPQHLSDDLHLSRDVEAEFGEEVQTR